jgi:hypothetical protein
VAARAWARILSVVRGRMGSIVTTTAPPHSLPIDLVDGPAGLLYLLPRAPLTLDDCETLAAVLTARAALDQHITASASPG